VALKTLALRADMWPVAEGPRGNVEFFVERLIRRPSVRLEVVHLHDPSFTDGIVYKVIVTATGGGLTRNESVYLFINSSEVFLPMIQKP
jgi:hypothetical protein